MLMCDGFLKSNGDVLTPLALELLSLLLNTVGNYFFVLKFEWGIAGAAYSSVLSRLIPALLGCSLLLRGSLGIPLSLRISTAVDKAEIWLTTKKLASLGVFESLGELTYGVVFTILMRQTGDLGSAQQAGLGAGMRGLEWISFTVGEGFLVAAMTAVGQCIGANMQHRAMQASWYCSILSGVLTMLVGIPFIFAPEKLAIMLSDDPKIVEYCSIYLR